MNFARVIAIVRLEQLQHLLPRSKKRGKKKTVRR
jgi:hypothetical protein